MASSAVFVSLVIIALLLERYTERTRLPFSIVLVIVGFVGSEIITGLGFDTGLRWHSFEVLILHILVPVLVFESAYKLPLSHLLPNLGLVLLMAIPGMVIAAVITAVGVYYGIGHPSFFPFAAALLTGVIASATDPVAVVAIFTKLGVPHRLTTLLEGESLFNDATAVVAYTLVLALALMPGESLEPISASIQFASTFGGGILAGAIAGLGGLLITKLADDDLHQTIVALCAGMMSFWLAEDFAHFSGIVAVLVCAIFMGEAHRRHLQDHKQTQHTLELGAWVANAIVFLLVGVSITFDMFANQWLTMLIAIGAAIAARAFNVYCMLPIATAVKIGGDIPLAWRHVIFWGGLRGGVSLALVLSVPVEVEAWYTVQAAVYGVVLFSLLVQATTAEPLIKKLIK